MRLSIQAGHIQTRLWIRRGDAFHSFYMGDPLDFSKAPALADWLLATRPLRARCYAIRSGHAFFRLDSGEEAIAVLGRQPSPVLGQAMHVWKRRPAIGEKRAVVFACGDVVSPVLMLYPPGAAAIAGVHDPELDAACRRIGLEGKARWRARKLPVDAALLERMLANLGQDRQAHAQAENACQHDGGKSDSERCTEKGHDARFDSQARCGEHLDQEKVRCAEHLDQKKAKCNASSDLHYESNTQPVFAGLACFWSESSLDAGLRVYADHPVALAMSRYYLMRYLPFLFVRNTDSLVGSETDFILHSPLKDEKEAHMAFQEVLATKADLGFGITAIFETCCALSVVDINAGFIDAPRRPADKEHAGLLRRCINAIAPLFAQLEQRAFAGQVIIDWPISPAQRHKLGQACKEAIRTAYPAWQYEGIFPSGVMLLRRAKYRESWIEARTQKLPLQEHDLSPWHILAQALWRTEIQLRHGGAARHRLYLPESAIKLAREKFPPAWLAQKLPSLRLCGENEKKTGEEGK